MARIYDLVMTHKLDTDDLFIHSVQRNCANAPDRADRAVKLPCGFIDGDTRRAIDKLEELPLPSELVPARH